MSSKGDKKSAPRRLFTFDNIKSPSSRRSSEGADKEPRKHVRAVSKPSASTLAEVKEVESVDELVDAQVSRAMSPLQAPSSRPASPAAPKFDIPRPGSAASIRPKTPENGRSASPASRWDTLRQHVLPPSRPSTPPTHVPRPSTSSISSSKPSRFPRLAFRQIVDHAKEANDTRKFAEEIFRTCQAIRYPSDGLKGKFETTMAGGSSMYLPFMSTSTLNTPNSTMNATAASKKTDSKRPQSQASLTNVSKGVPSVKSLYQILHYHSAPPSDSIIVPVYLPHENQVLSSLLTPFQMPLMSGKWEEERAFAIETFELLIKGWLPKDEAAGAERCLWCCKAALTPLSPNRSRILASLRRLLVPGDRNRWVVSPGVFQTIAHSLFILQAFLHSPHSGAAHQAEIDLVKELIDQFLSGSFGDMNEALVEEEYGIVWLPEDSKAGLRKAIFLEAIAGCIEHCALSTRVWLLLNAIEEYWPPPSHEQATLTALQISVHTRKLHTFCRAAYALLQTNDLEGGERYAVAQQIAILLETRVIPETGLLDTIHGLETRGSVVKVVLECLFLTDAKEVVRWAVTNICQWLHHEDKQWKTNLEKCLHKLISVSPWAVVPRLFSYIIEQIPDPDRKNVISIALPVLNDRMVDDPPSAKSPELSTLLDTLSRLYPQVFFKPLFLCAVSTKEVTVANHLCTLAIYSRYVEDFWLRDADMLAMALMSDTGAPKESVSWTSANVPWAIARLGQSVLMVELIGRLQSVRRLKESSLGSDSVFSPIARYIAALENRLTILIEAKERKALIAPSQRLLLCMLFREFRLLTRSVKPASWLRRTISWFSEFFVEEDLAGDLEQEVHKAMELIHGLYTAAQDGAKQSQQKRRSTMILADSPHKKQWTHFSTSSSEFLDLPALLEHRKPLIDGLLKGFSSKALKLFVVVSPMLTEGDYNRMAPILWKNGLKDSVDASATASACFIIMQCVEKTSTDTLALIEVDLRSSDDRTRLEAVRKIGILVNWRFQIMTQNVLTDRTHRPFKMARIPLPFVTTDMGTPLYIPTEDVIDSEGKSEVPVELKKQLVELGWVENDSGPIDPQQIWIKTPMSLLPTAQLDRMEFGAASNPLDLGLSQGIPGASPLPSPQCSPHRGAARKDTGDEPSLLRRNSTSGGPVASQKRRAIFVPPLATIFIRLTSLLHDTNFVIASATRSILLDLMRNDPSLLCRPVMDILAGEHKDIETAVSTLSNFLHVHQFLPPPMSHTIFNNLMGFLKYSGRQYDMPETLRDFALTVSVLSEVTTQVSGMSFREIRRSKTDAFVVPSGALWFPPSAPRGPMFPRGTEDFADPFEDITAKIISLTLVRISQNLLFLALLKKNGQEVNMIRKSITRFVLPSLSPEIVEPQAVELAEMIPGKQEHSIYPDSTIDTLSLVLARSHLMLLAQMFRAMSRHLSDRNELAIMIDGINRILCVHGHDIGIVGHSLIALMVATTRFRRLFTSRTAYTLFIPALVKVYTESFKHPGIRPAIEYAMSRFYALHKESFLYQSLGIVGQMAMLPNVDENSFSDSVYSLFFSLTKNLSTTVDAAAIHNINKGQEREALIVNTAEDKPQTFLAAMKRADSQASGQISAHFPEEYEADRMRMDNFIRLFLTVIAHDLSIVRAQHYLRLLRIMAPKLYNSSTTARTVVIEGISALGGIMIKGAPKSKDPAAGKTTDGSVLFPSTMENHSSDQSRISSDLKAMRLDYLVLILKIGQAGGEVSLKTARQALEIVKSILKDSGAISSFTDPEADSRILSSFLTDFVKMLLIREPPSLAKAVVLFLQDLAPLLHAYMVTVDFSGVFQTICELTSTPMYYSDPTFSQVVVGEICAAGLAACELAASENQFRLMLSLSYRSAFVKLLAECVFLRGADVVAQIEKRTPTYVFLAGVVFPLVLELKTEAHMNASGSRTHEHHRIVLSSAWIRLLFYAMGACQKSLLSGRGKDGSGGGLLSVAGSIGGSINRSKSREKGNDSEGGTGRGRRGTYAYNSQLRAQVPVFVMCLQIIKVIVIRAEMDISSAILGIWERMASFLKSMLADGDAEFAMRGKSLDGWKSVGGSAVPSPVASPYASPRTSAQLYPSSASNVNSSPNFIPVHSPTSPSFRMSSFPTGIDLSEPGSVLRRPRVLDYMLWSTLEFLWAYRSPLRLQLRLLTTEKVVALDTHLHLKGPTANGGRTPLSSYPSTPRSRRVSSVFVKNRGDRSLRASPAASPEVSPLLLPTSVSSNASHLNPPQLMLDTSTLKFPSRANSPFFEVQEPISISMNQRRPGYQVSPVSPVGRPFGAPKILHLGPASPSALHNHPYPTSPSGLLLSNSISGGGSRGSVLGSGFRPGIGGLGVSVGGGKKERGSGSRGNSSGRGRVGDTAAAVTMTGSDLVRNTKIKSIKLVEGTYKRIRGVQALMGYELLLPLPRRRPRRSPELDDHGDEGVGEVEDDDVVLKTWTKGQALSAIGQETKDLLEEFEYWMSVASAQDLDAEGNDDSEDEELEADTGAGMSVQVVDDFGVITTPGGRSGTIGGLGGRDEDRVHLLHPHSYVPQRQSRESWQSQGGESDGNERSSIVIEVDSTFAAPSPTHPPDRQ